MTLNQIYLFIAILLPIIILCSFATFTDLSGKWYGKLTTADNTPYPLTYNFTMLGDSVAGTAKSTLGEFPIEESRQDTTGLHFKVTVNGLDIFHTAKLYQDSIGMDISLNGSVVHCTLGCPPAAVLVLPKSIKTRKAIYY